MTGLPASTPRSSLGDQTAPAYRQATTVSTPAQGLAHRGPPRAVSPSSRPELAPSPVEHVPQTGDPAGRHVRTLSRGRVAADGTLSRVRGGSILTPKSGAFGGSP